LDKEVKKELNQFITTIRNMTNLQGTEAVTLDKLLAIPEFETELRKYRIDSDENLVTLIL